MKRLSLLTLVFAVLSLVFFLLLIFFRIPFPLYPLMNWQDVIDLLTPLVLIPIYWLMFSSVRHGKSGLADQITFMVMSAFWTAGQGMHLSANSINNLIDALTSDQGINIKGTDIYRLTYFFDEYLSHYLWHIGLLGLLALLLYNAWQKSSDDDTDWRLVAPAGVLYGFTYFCVFLEGQTLPIGLPFATIVTLLILFWGREKLARQPILAFTFVSCLVAFLLMVGWGVYWGGFPEFSDVGLI
jgi:hypothetical protein